MNLLSGAEISCSLSVLERVGIMEVSFVRKYMRILSGHWKLSVLERVHIREVSVPRGSAVFVSTTTYHVKGLNPGVISKVR